MTELQTLLLHACFGDGIRAWQRWREAVDIDHLDRHSQWLLPLLYRRLYAQRVEHPLMQRYKNVYLHNWYKNVLLLNAVKDVVVLLRSMPFIAKTGLGCVMTHYADVGVRPIDRAEICIPVESWDSLARRLRYSELQYHTHMADNGALDGSVPEAKRVVVHTKAHVPITIATNDEGLPAGWHHRLETKMFQKYPVTYLSEADTVAYLLAEHTRWDENSDLLWWADVVICAQSMARPAQDLLALVNPFLGEDYPSLPEIAGLMHSKSQSER